MSLEYKVTCQNNSELTGAFCIFQTLRHQEPVLTAQARSLSWLTKKVHSRTGTQFIWTDNLFFVWGEYAAYEVIHTASKLKADMDNPNRRSALLSYQDGAYILKYSNRADADEGKLLIHADDTVRNNEVVVGIGNFVNVSSCSVGAIVYDTLKNFNYPIQPVVDYYVTFGNYKSGQIIDLSDIVTPVKKIPFTPDKLSFKATMRKDNQIGVKVDDD